MEGHATQFNALYQAKTKTTGAPKAIWEVSIHFCLRRSHSCLFIINL